jgi:Fe-S-cluster containining protein
MTLDTCRGCGACCYIKAEVLGNDNVPLGLTSVHVDGFRWMRRTRNGRCVALDENNECSIYANRPVVCEQFPRNSDMCKKAIRALRGVG